MVTYAGLALLAAALAVWNSGLSSAGVPAALTLAGCVLIGVRLLTAARPEEAVGGPVRRVARAVDRLPAGVLLSGLVAFFGAPWALRYAGLYQSLGLSNFDAGIYNNIAYNCAHGRLFYSSVLQRGHLGEHFSPVMLLFAPLYRVWPNLAWLLAAQLVACLATPFLIYLAARAATPDRRLRKALGLALAAAWFLYRPMHAAMDFPFHPSTLAAPWIMAAFVLVERRKWIGALLALCFLLTLKENLAVVWLGFGLYLMLARRRYAAGAALACAGALLGCMLVGVVMPHFRATGWAHAVRFGPGADWGLKIRYLLGLLVPLAFIPLLQWRRGALALPAVLLNLMTRYPPQYSLGYHYDDLTAPLLFAACLPAGARLWTNTLRRLGFRARASVLLAVCAAALLTTAPSPARAFRKHPPGPAHAAARAELRELDASFPDALFYAQSHLGPHLNRYQQAQFPRDQRDCADYPYAPGSIIVLSEHVNPWGIPDLEACFRRLDAAPDRFERLRKYTALRVYRVQDRRGRGNLNRR